MKVVGHKSQSKAGRFQESPPTVGVHSLPDFAMTKVLAGELVIAHQKAVSNSAVHHLHDCVFIFREYFYLANQTIVPPSQTLTTPNLTIEYTRSINHNRVLQTAVAPIFLSTIIRP